MPTTYDRAGANPAGWPWLMPVPSGTCRVPVAPLQQINLKVPPRRSGSLAGPGCGRWSECARLVARHHGPPAEPQAGSGGAARLADRVTQLEALTADLQAQLAQLQAQDATPRSPAALQVLEAFKAAAV